MTASDLAHMRAALTLARRGLGRTAPNPAVGCILVRNDRVIGRGWTQPGGRPHAETEALRRAGEAARGATAYVSLEPCSHRGATGPCADSLIAAGIGRCLVACEDPDLRVSGNGIRRLRQAGVAVEVGLLREDALELNRGFISHRLEQRPSVTLKLATSLDGRIALASGASRWITGAEARQRAHLARAEQDAILVGSGTAVADNPRLDVRLPGLEQRKPLRAVLDPALRLPPTHDLITRAAEQKTLILTRTGHREEQLGALAAEGVEIVALTDCDPEGRPRPTAVLAELARRGITRLMIEGGAAVAASFLKDHQVDRLLWFRAGKIIGGNGRTSVETLALDALSAAPHFALQQVEPVGGDLLETWVRKG